MSSVSYSILVVLSSLLVQTVTSQPVSILSQQGNETTTMVQVQTVPSNSYEYQIVPSSDYGIVAYSSEPTPSDAISSLFAAVVSLGSSAFSVARWLFINSSLVLLGMATVVGFCALSPYCTLTIEIPSFAREYSSSFPYFDDLEHYFSQAYYKYKEMQRRM